LSLELALKALIVEIVKEVTGAAPTEAKSTRARKSSENAAPAGAESTTAHVDSAKKQPAQASSVTRKAFTDAFLDMFNEKGKAAAARVLEKFKVTNAKDISDANLDEAYADVQKEAAAKAAPAEIVAEEPPLIAAFKRLMKEKGRTAGERILAKYKAERASLIKSNDVSAAIIDI